MRRSAALAVVVLCCACATGLLAFASGRATAAPKRKLRPSHHAAALHARRTRWVYRQAGVSLPPYSVAQWSYGRRVSRRALAPGDLVFFSGLGHVGIYLGHGAVIHAPHPGAKVRFERMHGWLSSSFYGARRLRLAG
jgi:NlpC/P60 family